MKREIYLKIKKVEEEIERLETYTETNIIYENSKDYFVNKIEELRNLKKRLLFKGKMEAILNEKTR